MSLPRAVLMAIDAAALVLCAVSALSQAGEAAVQGTAPAAAPAAVSPAEAAATDRAPAVTAPSEAPVSAPAASDSPPGDRRDGDEATTRPAHREHHRLTPAQVLDEHVQALARQLELDAPQQKLVREVLIRERLALIRLRNASGAEAEDKVAAAHAILKKRREEMREILTPEQRRKYFVEVPDDNLGPRLVDRDYWLSISRGHEATAAPPAAESPANR